MKKHKLAILVPTISERGEMFEELKNELNDQINKSGLNAIVLHVIDNGQHPIGKKRNELLGLGVRLADYVCFFDDDDWPSQNYISSLMFGINNNYDCCSLRGVMLTDGDNPELFEHSLRYTEWITTNNFIKYERYPNHLNCIKSEIASQFKFKEISHGEDRVWSTEINNSGLLKREYYIPGVIYVYRFNSKK